MRVAMARRMKEQTHCTEAWLRWKTKEEAAARELERLEGTERRVEHLQRVAARRIGLGAARGWSAWHAAWEERRRQRQMLASAGAKRRALARGLGGGARAEERSRAEALLSAAQARERGGLEAEVERLRAELEAELGRRGAAASGGGGGEGAGGAAGGGGGAAADRSAGGGEGEADCAPAPVCGGSRRNRSGSKQLWVSAARISLLYF